ncbi:YcnI family protein [Antribacter sp. KLBMP9083]|uniref:YcnI family protein n=1 Tax=Antribacter soli TaxID=2910976 RepID=A0AA41U745_9MICO|nr:YcnI family protein [Antribacter soli]MCF4121693.1 YcnI family protein [Antribacter soli]
MSARFSLPSVGSLPKGRLVAVVLATAVLALLPVAPASAHVSVKPDATAEGGRAGLTFRVPTESDTASTSRLTVDLPTGTPFRSVSAKVLPGWDITIEEGELPAPVEVDGETVTTAPVRVVWTAQPGSEIPPHQYQEFTIRVNALPEAGTDVVLPAHQEYSDGRVVDWDQVADGDTEPEHPAPVFTTTSSDDAGAAGTAATAATADSGHDTSAGAGDADSDATASGAAASSADLTGRLLGAGGLVVGAAGVGIGLAAVRRRAD